MARTLVAIGLGLGGCMMPKTPGELVGSYHISAELTDNTCGQSALPAAPHLSFNVDIRRDKHGGGYWSRGMPPARSGELDDDGHFSFELQSTYTVGAMAKDPIESLIEMDPAKLADPQIGDRLDQAPKPPCQLTVTETMHGSLQRVLHPLKDGGAADTGSAADDLVADEDISIRGASGCDIVLATHGGPFDALPCKAHYDFKGKLASP